ncbi:MAG: hypothetical protein IPM68_18150 [Flavobacteriales bacterium]|nr:hypothetical protein [Flavobacteriales bacterium]
MRRTTLAFPLLISLPLLAQPQLDNPGFESWQNVGTGTEEPTEWSSVKTSDGGTLINNLAPQMVWRSSDAHSGSYSVNIRTVSSFLGPATGLLTNGRVHAELQVENSYVFTDTLNGDWSTACASRPDSLIGWYKYTPQPGDQAVIGVLMHVDDAKLPAFGTELNWVGGADWTSASATVGAWTRFATPFVYTDNREPEHILMIMTSGDSTSSQVGTEVWFDDLALIYNLAAVPDAAVAYVTAQDGFDLNVAYSTGGVPTAALDFTAELSDANGDFSAPVAIGTLNSDQPTGVIACTVPAGTVPGTGYRIRVTTPSPYYAPIDSGIVVEVSTGIALSSVPQDWRVWADAEALWLDLRGSALQAERFEVVDARGALVAAGRATPGMLRPVVTSGIPGLYVVRLHHADGVASVRLIRS